MALEWHSLCLYRPRSSDGMQMCTRNVRSDYVSTFRGAPPSTKRRRLTGKTFFLQLLQNEWMNSLGILCLQETGAHWTKRGKTAPSYSPTPPPLDTLDTLLYLERDDQNEECF